MMFLRSRIAAAERKLREISANEDPGLTPEQIETFIADGFVKLENAFSRALAGHCRDEFRAVMGPSPDAPESWVQPVVGWGSGLRRPS